MGIALPLEQQNEVGSTGVVERGLAGKLSETV